MHIETADGREWNWIRKYVKWPKNEMRRDNAQQEWEEEDVEKSATAKYIIIMNRLTDRVAIKTENKMIISFLFPSETHSTRLAETERVGRARARRRQQFADSNTHMRVQRVFGAQHISLYLFFSVFLAVYFCVRQFIFTFYVRSRDKTHSHSHTAGRPWRHAYVRGELTHNVNDYMQSFRVRVCRRRVVFCWRTSEFIPSNHANHVLRAARNGPYDSNMFQQKIGMRCATEQKHRKIDVEWSSCGAFLPGTRQAWPRCEPSGRRMPCQCKQNAWGNIWHPKQNKKKMKRSHWVRFRCVCVAMPCISYVSVPLTACANFHSTHAHTWTLARSHACKSRRVVARANFSGVREFFFRWWCACPLMLSTVGHAIHMHTSAARWLPNSIRSFFSFSFNFCSCIANSWRFANVSRALFSFLNWFSW